MPVEPLGPPEPRPSYSTCMLLHNVLRILPADNCEIVITTEIVSPAVRAAGDLLPAFGVEPGHWGIVTRPLPQARPLSGDQRRAVERARDFLGTAAGSWCRSEALPGEAASGRALSRRGSCAPLRSSAPARGPARGRTAGRRKRTAL